MRQLLQGAVAAASLVAALHFLKFWRRSGDRLFAFFAAAFAVMGANGVALGLTDPDNRVPGCLLRRAAARFRADPGRDPRQEPGPSPLRGRLPAKASRSCYRAGPGFP